MSADPPQAEAEADDLPADLPDKLFFRIGEAASLVGVEAHVLRYWESEFKMRTQRSSTGQRMYRRKDISQFLKIRRLLHDDGFTIAGARKALAEGTLPTANGGKGGADTTRVREALERLSGLRGTIQETRKRYANIGVAALLEDG